VKWAFKIYKNDPDYELREIKDDDWKYFDENSNRQMEDINFKCSQLPID
jgi:hypothetical protein